jgi:hypothetical protein
VNTTDTAAMPLGEQEGLLIGAGVTLSLATTYFYRQRQTLPFKVQQDNAADAGVHGCKQHVSSSCVREQDGCMHTPHAVAM